MAILGSAFWLLPEFFTMSMFPNISENKEALDVGVVLRKNMGAAFTRNLGLRLSTSDYIAFMDADDKWASNKLKDQIDFMQKNNQVDRSDLIVVDDGAGGTNRKAALSRVVTLVSANIDDPTALAIALG